MAFVIPREYIRFGEHIDELKRLCKERGFTLSFLPTGRNQRKYLYVEGNLSYILVFFTEPNPDRDWDKIAWNRISKADSVNLKEYHNTEQNNKQIHCVVIQIWENIPALIPLDKLLQIPMFIQKGDFKVKQDGYGYCLETPRGEENIRLNIGLDKIFDYF